jgi:hypothetical protein
MRKLSSSADLLPTTEVLIDGIWLPYCECQTIPNDTIDPDTIKPCVAFPVKVLGVGVFEVRINGVIQNQNDLTITTNLDEIPYKPEVMIYWGLV